MQHLTRALDLLAARGVVILRISNVYESAAHRIDEAPQPDFLNAVVEVATDFDPEDLLDVLLDVERTEGRRREGRWQPRTLDLDILAFGERTISSGRLDVPHPRLAERRFVLLPWNDIAPEVMVPPPHAATVRELLDRSPDTAAIRLAIHSSTLDTPPS